MDIAYVLSQIGTFEQRVAEVLKLRGASVLDYAEARDRLATDTDSVFVAVFVPPCWPLEEIGNGARVFSSFEETRDDSFPVPEELEDMFERRLPRQVWAVDTRWHEQMWTRLTQLHSELLLSIAS